MYGKHNIEFAWFMVFAITGVLASNKYSYFEKGSARVCLSVDNNAMTTTTNCCTNSPKVRLEGGKLIIGNDACFTCPCGDGLKPERGLSDGSCKQFAVSSERNLKVSGTNLCLSEIHIDIRLRDCPSSPEYKWSSNDDVCPPPRAQSYVVKKISQLRGTRYRSVSITSYGDLVLKDSSAASFYLYSNNELWTTDNTSCVGLKDKWPKILQQLDGMTLKRKAGDCGRFKMHVARGTYELLHTGYCMKDDDNLPLRQCSQISTSQFTETATSYSPPAGFTLPRSSASITRRSVTESPGSSAIVTTSSVTKSPGSASVPNNLTETQPSNTTMLTATFSDIIKTSESVNFHATPISTFESTPQLKSSLSINMITTVSSNMSYLAQGLNPTSSASLNLPSITNISVQNCIDTSLSTREPEDWQTGMPSDQIAAKRKCGEACADLFLADPGQQCLEFCHDKGLSCSNKINTGNSDIAITSAGGECSGKSNMKQWKNAYDPAYYIRDKVCAGYINVNETVSCIVEGFKDRNVRRLCRCLSSAEDEKFSPWTTWSPCSLSCGRGFRTRSRICNAENCVGDTMEEQCCNSRPCQVDGGFSPWSSWSTCSVSCGGGNRFRYRSCSNPYPEYNGFDCFGVRNVSDICNSHFCPIDGSWTKWTDWSACDKPCNTGMYRRWRYCTNPSPLYGGNQCVGNSIEAIPCNTRKCHAEVISVRALGFDLPWNDALGIQNSEAFLEFSNDLETNNRLLFKFSAVNSTYLYCSIKSLRKGSIIATFNLHFSSLDLFQTLLLQDSIEVDKYLGKLKIIGSNYDYNSTSVPSAAPMNFTVKSLSGSSVYAEWNTVARQHQNGNITGYILFYREKLQNAALYHRIATEEMNMTIQGLNVYTQYVFRVLAYNEHGNGIASEEKLLFTLESVPSQPPVAVNASGTSGFTIIVEWQHILPEEWNGIPVGSVVKFDDTKGHSGNVTVNYPQSFAILENLVPTTTYVIDVCEATTLGIGPCQRTQGTTLTTVPTKAPSNVTVESYIAHSKLRIYWNHLPLKYTHGYLGGYKVIYQLIKIGVTPVIAQPKIIRVHPSLNQLTLKNLESNAQYEVQVLAFNEQGDGVASAIHYGDTCACPPKIFTNFAASAPYISRDKSGKMIGLFVDILNNITTFSCGRCAQQSVLDFISNGKNGFAEKNSLAEMKNDIDDFVHLSFPVFGSTELETYNSYAFVSVFPHPGVLYVIIRDSFEKQIHHMLNSVLATWPIFLINLLLIALSGFIFWALDSRLNAGEIPQSCLPGVLSAIYWAYITMGTHGYGDITPRSKLARLFAILWMLIGMVNLSLLTSALTTAMTTGQVYNDPKMYGVKVAAVHGTVAYNVGVYKNAMLNAKSKYKSTEEVAAALKRRDVRGALVDVFSAATRSDLFKHPDIVAKKLIKYPRSFGFVLSGDMNNAASNFRDYLRVHSDDILKTIEKRTAGLELDRKDVKTVSLFQENSPFFRITLLAFGVLLLVACICGCTVQYYRSSARQHKIKPMITSELDEIERICDENLFEFYAEIQNKMGKRIEQQIQERIKLSKLKKR